MTVLTFPSSPESGDTYSAPNGTLYTYDGVKWAVTSTSITSDTVTNFVQDAIAPIFENITSDGISFTYDAETNSLSASVTGGISINDFGDGFGLDNSDKIVTRKLYSTNETNSGQHYRLELDTNGVVHLPDQSIINGATLKSVAGNYAGITAGPVGKDEDSWMWVDANGSWIATDYSTNAYTWQFGNDGTLQLPYNGTVTQGNTRIRSANGSFNLNTPTVIWSSSASYISSVKLVIQIEAEETGDASGMHSQTCEAIISSRGWNSGLGEPVMTVYGVVHTSVQPLATFTVQRNATTRLIEVLATPTVTASGGGVYYGVSAVEITTWD